jgi:hypothetical protein
MCAVTLSVCVAVLNHYMVQSIVDLSHLNQKKRNYWDLVMFNVILIIVPHFSFKY